MERPSTQHPLEFLGIHFGFLQDPRLERRKLHELLDIIGLSIMAVVSGADGWVSVEEYGEAKKEFLRAYLPLSNGIPSHDTIGRVFSLLDAQAFEKGFASWTQAVCQLAQGEVVAVDGKTLRHSHDASGGKAAIHLVSAWASANGVGLGQVKVDDKSNEITAIPKLLQVLDLSGCIVTIDAMGTQKDIARLIRQQGADYLLALKANHAELHEEVTSAFRHLQGSRFCCTGEEWDKGHGRIECRRCHVIDLNARDFDWLLPTDLAGWKDLNTLVMIDASRWVNEREERQQRYYLSSLSALRPPEFFNRAVRSHWQIENGCHWTLDVAFGEDACRIRKGFADQNFSILRRLALNLLKNEKTLKIGVRNKRLRAAWDNDYLLKVLRC